MQCGPLFGDLADDGVLSVSMVALDADRSGPEAGADAGSSFHCAKRLFQRICGIDLVAKHIVDVAGVDMRRAASAVTASITCCSRCGSSTCPPVRNFEAATGSAICRRCAAASTSACSGLVTSAPASGAPSMANPEATITGIVTVLAVMKHPFQGVVNSVD